MALTVTSINVVTTDYVTVNYTSDEVLTNVELTKDDSNYIIASSFNQTSAMFNISNWENGTYSNCYLRGTYITDEGEEEVVVITLNTINNMTIEKGSSFYIYYSTNTPAIKHEFSWDNGATFWDKTDEVTTQSSTSYKYLHDPDTEYSSFAMAVRVTDSNGYTSTRYFTVTFEEESTNDFTFTQYKRLDNGVVTDTSEKGYFTTVNKNSVTSDSLYTVSVNSANYICVCFYNTSDNYIDYYEANTSDWSVTSFSTTFTIPSSAAYIRVCAINNGTQVTGTLTRSSSSLLDSSGAYIVDDFSGSSVDTNKWTYELGYVRNGETQRYTGSNAEINNGILALRGLKDSDGNWTSSSIISHGKFAFMYGKIEARIRMCNYNGAFGAFWTLGDSFEFGYNEWGSPDTLGEWWAWCGEFDIVEFYNGKLTCGTFFNEKEESGRVYTTNYSTGDWHNFAMEWNTDGSLKFYIDDDLISSTSATTNRAFHIPHYILVNQAIGASGGTPDDGCSEITQYVDWIKYYPLSTDNLVLNSSDFYLTATDFNDSSHNCMLRPTFNDNCINKSLTWYSSNSDLVWVHGGLCASYAGAYGTVTVTAISQSGATASINLTVTDGVLSV